MIDAAVEALATRIAGRSERLGRRIDVRRLGALDRSGHLPLRAPGQVSPNGACRLIRARDAWLALNLARPEDWGLLPAWLETEDATCWEAVEALAATRPCAPLLAAATLLGLPVSRVGETPPGPTPAAVHRQSARPAVRASDAQVLDLSALWAGPLCGAILAELGAPVTKIESPRRPDPTAHHTPRFDAALNGAKHRLTLDFHTPEGSAQLTALLRGATVLITSARPRGLASIGLTAERIFAENPRLIWVAITGHGWRQGSRVAFGDDAAAAGGLVRWSAEGEPRFAGDALADPITGLSAAASALDLLAAGHGGMVDAAMAPCAAAARVLAEPAAA